MNLFDRAFLEILKVEGETYTNNSLDRGGPTKYGITLKTFNDFTGVVYDESAIQSLTKETARSIYKTYFWYKLNIDRIGISHPRIALVIFDQAVNRGSFGAGRMLQKAINEVSGSAVVADDGIIGENTLSALSNLDEKKLGLQIFKNAQISYIKIVKNNPDQIAFLEGWIRRTHNILNTLNEAA